MLRDTASENEDLPGWFYLACAIGIFSLGVVVGANVF